MNDTFCATRKDVHRFAGFEGEAVGRSCQEVRDEEDLSDSERLHLDLVRLAVLALYVPLWSSVRGGVFKYNQLAVYSSARTAVCFAWPVLSSRMCLLHFSSLTVSSVQLRLLAQHSRASRCCLVLLAQGSPEHLFCSFRFGYLPTNLCLTKQWHKAKRPHTTTF